MSLSGDGGGELYIGRRGGERRRDEERGGEKWKGGERAEGSGVEGREQVGRGGDFLYSSL